MKEQTLSAGYNDLLLQQLVDGLVGNSLPLAKSNGSDVVNEVGRAVVLQQRNVWMIDLVDELLRTVIRNSREGDIHISAEQWNGNLVIHVQERNNYNGYALSFSLGPLASDAAKYGAYLDIQSPNKLVTTISLSVPEVFAA